jgi:hypothetical protein
MNKYHFRWLRLAGVAFGVGWSVATVTCGAQGFGQGGPPPGPGGFQGRQGRGFGGPMGFRFGPGGFMMDPRQSNAMVLLGRPDVQQELGLSQDQRQKIGQIQRDMAQQRMQKMRDWMQQNPPPSRSDFDSMTPEERQELFQKRQSAMAALQQELQDEEQKQLAQVLTDDQQRRLQQLDLQWRTALALADDKLAAKLNLNDQQRQEIQQIWQQYLQTARQTMASLFNRGGNDRFNGPPGGPPGPPPNDQGAPPPPGGPGGPPPGPAGGPPQRPFGRGPGGFGAQFAQLEQKLYQQRVDAGKKVLALLTPDQLAQWQQMTGKPFTFHFEMPGGPPPPPGDQGPPPPPPPDDQPPLPDRPF